MEEKHKAIQKYPWSPLEPLCSSKKKKVSTIMTFRPINLPFCSKEKSYWCRFEKKEKSHHGASTLVWEKSHNGALNCTKMTFLQNWNKPHLLKSTLSWLFSITEMKHLCDFSLLSQLNTQLTSMRANFSDHVDKIVWFDTMRFFQVFA